MYRKVIIALSALLLLAITAGCVAVSVVNEDGEYLYDVPVSGYLKDAHLDEGPDNVHEATIQAGELKVEYWNGNSSNFRNKAVIISIPAGWYTSTSGEVAYYAGTTVEKNTDGGGYLYFIDVDEDDRGIGPIVLKKVTVPLSNGNDMTTSTMLYRVKSSVRSYSGAGDITLSCRGLFERFAGVTCDGIPLVQGTDYVAKADADGRTEIVLSEAFLNTLAKNAKHTFVILFNNLGKGTAIVPFK